MSDLLKIVTTGLEALNLVQDNVQQALPDRSDITEGVLLENVSFPGTVNHGLGRQALGAIVLKQSDGANFVAVTELSSTSITTVSAGSGTASLWVF